MPSEDGWEERRKSAAGGESPSRAGVCSQECTKAREEQSRGDTLPSGTYTFRSLSNIPFMVSMARVAAS